MTELEKQLSEKLSFLLKKTDLTVTKEQQKQLVKLVLLLNKWNKAYNLTSVRDPQEMLVKHILDSLVVSPYLKGTTFIEDLLQMLNYKPYSICLIIKQA